MVRTKEPDGEREEEGKDLLHDCRVRWVCQERRGKTENTQLIDLCTFAYWYLNPFFFLAQFDSFKWICVTKVSLSCVFIMTSHHIPDNRRRPPYYRMHYIYCPPFYLSVRFLKRGIPANTKVLIWVAYWYERQYDWCQRMYPSRPRPKQYNWYKNINDIKSTLEYTEETKNWFQVDLVQHLFFFIYLCPPLLKIKPYIQWTLCPDALSRPSISTYVYLLCCHRNSSTSKAYWSAWRGERQVRECRCVGVSRGDRLQSEEGPTEEDKHSVGQQ